MRLAPAAPEIVAYDARLEVLLRPWLLLSATTTDLLALAGDSGVQEIGEVADWISHATAARRKRSTWRSWRSLPRHASAHPRWPSAAEQAAQHASRAAAAKDALEPRRALALAALRAAAALRLLPGLVRLLDGPAPAFPRYFMRKLL